MAENSLSRWLIFFIGIPVIVGFIALPVLNHLPINLIIIAASAIGAAEIADIFKKMGYPIRSLFAVFLGSFLPFCAYFVASGLITPTVIVILLTALTSFILLLPIFVTNPDEFASGIHRISGYLSILIYPGFFMAYLVMLSSLPLPTLTMIAFAFMCFFNDSFAWLFGKFFGKDSRGVFPISPNKSLVGFIFGFIGSNVMALFWFWIEPAIFANSIFVALIAGVLIGISTILGDLIESAIKRSSRTKDSGSIIPGRGGILDSVDSLLFSAPVFFYTITFANMFI
ncbi:MAG: phosphatidate cytidylyltransferase [Spirochaetia bacterium]